MIQWKQKRQDWRVIYSMSRDRGKRYVLNGAVYGHPKFEDGERIYTSFVKKVSKFDTSFVFETCNTIYQCFIEDLIPEYKTATLEFLNKKMGEN